MFQQLANWFNGLPRYRRRNYSLLAGAILLTLPYYCVGMVLWILAPAQPKLLPPPCTQVSPPTILPAATAAPFPPPTYTPTITSTPQLAASATFAVPPTQPSTLTLTPAPAATLVSAVTGRPGYKPRCSAIAATTHGR